MPRVALSKSDRLEIAEKMAPLLKEAVASGGTYTTLQNAYKSLVDTKNKLEVTPAEISPDRGAAAGVIIIITS